MSDIFYTYAYLRKSDRTPYYVGKGKGKRAYDRQGHRVKVPDDKDRIIFLKQNLTEEEAFNHEKYMIAVLGRKDLGTGILRNMSDGGEGPSNPSPESRRKNSERNRKAYEEGTNPLTKFTHEERKKYQSMGAQARLDSQWLKDNPEYDGGSLGRTGAIVPCCQTLGPPNEEKSILGHLDKNSFEDIYFGEEYEKLRKAHENKDFDKIDYCKDCDFLYDDPEILIWSNDKTAKVHHMLGTDDDFILTNYNK